MFDEDSGLSRDTRDAGQFQVSGSNLYVARRGSSLHVCAAADRFNVARMLIEEAGADVDNAAGPQQSRPLHIAARCGLKGESHERERARTSQCWVLVA